MMNLFLRLILVTVLCGYMQETYAQVRVRKGIHLPKFRHKERSSGKKIYMHEEQQTGSKITITKPPAKSPQPLDDHFYVKWNKNRPLVYDDFKYNRNLYNKLVPDDDTDLINTVYPDYLAFYNTLKERIGNGAYMDEAQDERIERLLQLKTDSLEKGYITSASIYVDLSFTITIDSPAASVINLQPVIYPLNETSWYFNITPVFNKYESWMIVKSKDILQHEQIHFDIFELHARKMRKYLLEALKKSNAETASGELSQHITLAYEKLYQQLNQMQLDFDKETGELTLANAPLTKINAAWVKSLKAQLNALSEYETAEGTIILK